MNPKQKGHNEKMHGHLWSGTCIVGVFCRWVSVWSKVIVKENEVDGDQRDKQTIITKSLMKQNQLQGFLTFQIPVRDVRLLQL